MTDPTILLIEDETICADFIRHILSTEGFQTIPVNSGTKALEILANRTDQIDAILLDRGLPDIDGFNLLTQIKHNPAFRNIPVILETASTDDASIEQGLAAGAYYYLTKPLNANLLRCIVKTAVEQYRDTKALLASINLTGQTLYQHLEQAVFRFRTLEEARSLAQLLSLACPAPERVVIGLQELLINAVEHGNLGISYAEKTQLMLQGQWLEEVDRRLSLPDLGSRRVEVGFQRKAEAICYTIRDEGAGFDWQNYLRLDPTRAFDPNGKGIALANMMSFDSLAYLGRGNTVEASIFALRN
ncbi:response regulator [Methylomonas rivi]|uniref:Response regulator n=1 Tax=Methylomonas rivi TaxID=2952226 RepID=A0ABT1UAL4_9GAMM|nr:response regulator [Methylomonas sp. WSC-6]MCQ8130101.1 response regulator [Methylomonas sp. WSC-6]